jgi:hypothetical protein
MKRIFSAIFLLALIVVSASAPVLADSEETRVFDMYKWIGDYLGRLVKEEGMTVLTKDRLNISEGSREIVKSCDFDGDGNAVDVTFVIECGTNTDGNFEVNVRSAAPNAEFGCETIEPDGVSISIADFDGEPGDEILMYRHGTDVVDNIKIFKLTGGKFEQRANFSPVSTAGVVYGKGHFYYAKIPDDAKSYTYAACEYDVASGKEKILERYKGRANASNQGEEFKCIICSILKNSSKITCPISTSDYILCKECSNQRSDEERAA